MTEGKFYIAGSDGVVQYFKCLHITEGGNFLGKMFTHFEGEKLSGYASEQLVDKIETDWTEIAKVDIPKDIRKRF